MYEITARSSAKWLNSVFVCTAHRSQPTAQAVAWPAAYEARWVVWSVSGQLIVLSCYWSPSVTRCRDESFRMRLIGLNLHVVSLSCADRPNEMRSLSTETTTIKKKETTASTSPRQHVNTSRTAKCDAGSYFFINTDICADICVDRFPFSLLHADNGLATLERHPNRI